MLARRFWRFASRETAVRSTAALHCATSLSMALARAVSKRVHSAMAVSSADAGEGGERVAWLVVGGAAGGEAASGCWRASRSGVRDGGTRGRYGGEGAWAACVVHGASSAEDWQRGWGDDCGALRPGGSGRGVRSVAVSSAARCRGTSSSPVAVRKC